MTQNIIFISFYTNDGQYPQLARKLKKSLNKFNLENYIFKVNKKFNTWEEGTHFKSTFILDSLLKFRESVVWLDIDTEIWKFPELLFDDHDFAIYNWIADKDHHLDGKILFDPKAKSLLCSGGVQKYAYKASVIQLLKEWINIIKVMKNKKMGDDPCLDIAFNNGNFDLKTLWLPKTYNRMDNHSIYWSKISEDSIYINHSYVAGKHREKSFKRTKGF